MTHTPGPWEVIQHNHVDGDLWLTVNQHADEHGMKEWVAEIKYLTTDNERQWANARLLAAAPELLAALKDTTAELRAIHDYFYRDIHGGIHFDLYQKRNRGTSPCPSGCPAETYIAAAEAAIAKAEGTK